MVRNNISSKPPAGTPAGGPLVAGSSSQGEHYSHSGSRKSSQSWGNPTEFQLLITSEVAQLGLGQRTHGRGVRRLSPHNAKDTRQGRSYQHLHPTCIQEKPRLSPGYGKCPDGAQEPDKNPPPATPPNNHAQLSAGQLQTALAGFVFLL